MGIYFQLIYLIKLNYVFFNFFFDYYQKMIGIKNQVKVRLGLSLSIVI